jgi:hypothetical protein
MLVMGIRQTVGEVDSLEQTPRSGFAWANVNSIGGSVESLNGCWAGRSSGEAYHEHFNARAMLPGAQLVWHGSEHLGQRLLRIGDTGAMERR